MGATRKLKRLQASSCRSGPAVVNVTQGVLWPQAKSIQLNGNRP